MNVIQRRSSSTFPLSARNSGVRTRIGDTRADTHAQPSLDPSTGRNRGAHRRAHTHLNGRSFARNVSTASSLKLVFLARFYLACWPMAVACSIYWPTGSVAWHFTIISPALGFFIIFYFLHIFIIISRRRLMIREFREYYKALFFVCYSV